MRLLRRYTQGAFGTEVISVPPEWFRVRPVWHTQLGPEELDDDTKFFFVCVSVLRKKNKKKTDKKIEGF